MHVHLTSELLLLCSKWSALASEVCPECLVSLMHDNKRF